MKKIAFVIFILLSVFTAQAQEPVTGMWNTGNENTKIQITEEKGICTGKIFSSDNPNAPIGKVLLKEVKLAEGVWKGKLYAAKKGKWMDATLHPKDNKLLITVDAGFMSKTIEWMKD